MHQPAKNALNRYLAELGQALSSSPKAAKENALSDAEEFLSDEISSPDAMHLTTSEQQTYDHCIASYGSPSQVASEYLQAWETASQELNATKHWKSLAVAATAVIVLIGTVGAVYFENFQTSPKHSSFTQMYDEGKVMPPKISPFTQVNFEGDKIFVEVNGKTYQWLGIDNIPVSKVIASSQKQFRDYWRKRITEDLVEVLWGMGHYPENTVKLQLYDTQESKETIIAAAPMTRENRQSMYGNYPVTVVNTGNQHEIVLRDKFAARPSVARTLYFGLSKLLRDREP